MLKKIKKVGDDTSIRNSRESWGKRILKQRKRFSYFDKKTLLSSNLATIVKPSVRGKVKRLKRRKRKIVQSKHPIDHVIQQFRQLWRLAIRQFSPVIRQLIRLHRSEVMVQDLREEKPLWEVKNSYLTYHVIISCQHHRCKSSLQRLTITKYLSTIISHYCHNFICPSEP